jgi:hypothetical protein
MKHGFLPGHDFSRAIILEDRRALALWYGLLIVCMLNCFEVAEQR